MKLKVCRICGLEKPVNLYSKNKAKEDGLHYNCKSCDAIKVKIWYSSNKEKAIKSRNKYRLENIEKVKKLDQDRYYSNKEEALVARKKYYENNKERVLQRVSEWSAKNKDKTRAYVRKWNRENAGRISAIEAERRAQQLKATPAWLSSIQKNQISEMYEIAKALNVQTGIAHHVDHIFPLKGKNLKGLHVPWNLRVITAEENLKKGNTIPVLEVIWG